MESSRISNLGENLVGEILLRLRVKTLLRCKCVCKQWCGLIGSRGFINAHFNHESNPDFLLIQILPKLERTYFTYALYYDDERHTLVQESNHQLLLPAHAKVNTLLGPANGIFCAVSHFSGGSIVLLNPAMREFKLLPPLPLHDPSDSLFYGFGSDPISGDHKVVVVHKSNGACVYSLSSDSWKIIGAPVDLLSSVLFVLDHSMCNMFVNGVYYWLMEFDNDGGFSILAFDMRTENFQEIRVPDGLKHLDAAAYGDSLALLSSSHDLVGRWVDLWVMGKQGFWSKSLRLGAFDEHELLCCVWKKNEMLWTSETLGLILRDFSTHKVREVGPRLKAGSFVSDVFSYKESLVSIKGDGDDGGRAHCVPDFYFDSCMASI